MSTQAQARREDFYVNIFRDIAMGMVSRPKDLQVKVQRLADSSVRDITLPRSVVLVTPHANDFGAIVGAQAKNLLAFKMLLRNAAALKQEQCELSIQEGTGKHERIVPVPLDPKWNRDDELVQLIWRTIEDCFGLIPKPRATHQEGATVITLDCDGVIPDEGFYGLATLFKNWGRGQGRTVRLERV